MGLFNFFKKKPSDNKKPEVQETSLTDNNSYLLETLSNRIKALGFEVNVHPNYLAIIVNSELEIATVIIDNPNNHPNVMQLMILTIHHAYFPDGIEENIVGVGTSIKDKVSSVLDNYINTTFLPIIASLSNRHNPEFNFSVIADEGKEVIWHTTLGNVRLQGEWIDQNQNEPFFEIVKDKIKNRLSSDKINWLKVYVSKRADGTIIGECLLNNIPWEEGWADLKKYAESWEMKSNFQGIKQFIVFRRCEVHQEK